MEVNSVAKALINFINGVLEAVCSADGGEGNFTLALEEDYWHKIAVLLRASMNEGHPKVNIETIITDDDNEVFGEILAWNHWEKEELESGEPLSF